MSYKISLYVDDIRNAPEGWACSRTYQSTISLFETGWFEIDKLSLDHDLGEEKTGYDIAKYIVENNIKINEIFLHTANPVGRDNMYQLLTRYGYKVN